MGDQPIPKSLPSLNRRNVIRSLLFKIPTTQQGPRFAPALSLTNNNSDSYSSASTENSDHCRKPRSSSNAEKLGNSPYVSAQSWAVLDYKTGKIIGGLRQSQSREIASLTKIMTCVVALQMTENYGLSFETLVKVSKNAAETAGTTARIKEGEELQV